MKRTEEMIRNEEMRDRIVLTKLGLIEDLLRDRMVLEDMLEDLIERMDEETKLREHHRAYLNIRQDLSRKCREYEDQMDTIKRRWREIDFCQIDMEEVVSQWE